LLGGALLGCAGRELLTGRLGATLFAALLRHLALHGHPATPADADTVVFVVVAAVDHTQQLRVCLPYPPWPSLCAALVV
jgi:hypothetical protein